MDRSRHPTHGHDHSCMGSHGLERGGKSPRDDGTGHDGDHDDDDDAITEDSQHGAGKKPKLGSGGRFKALTKKLEAGGKSAGSAKAIAASIGRKKYGAKKMAKLSAKGK